MTTDAEDGRDEAAPKRQRIVHLSPLEHCLQRPDMYIGPLEPTQHVIPDFASSPPVHVPRVVSPALVALMNELVTNALDNIQRGEVQRRIDIAWNGTVFSVENDGSTLSVVPHDEGEGGVLPLVLAFGTFQSGSNFDDATTGRKDTIYTAGRNGVGAKGCNAFGHRMTVTVGNAHERKLCVVTWERNMSLMHPIQRASRWTRRTNSTCVEWVPDFARLKTTDEDVLAHMNALASWLAHNASLCAPPTVRVRYNGTPLALRTPAEFCRALGGEAPIATDTVVHNGVEVFRIAVASRTAVESSPPPGLTYAFVNCTPCCEGSHAKFVLSTLATMVETKASTRRNVRGNVHVTPLFLRSNAVVVLCLLTENERFTSQTKRCFDTPVGSWGWPRWVPSREFRSAVERSTLVDRIIDRASDREDTDAIRLTKATSRHPSIPKYEPALARNTGRATLIVCEGDSAANFVRSGLATVGKRDFGLYPLRGKFLNTRGLSFRAISENKEANELLRILGIELQAEYTLERVSKLPYARLMVMSDQDVDGSHIAGLVFNFIDTCAPSLLRVRSDFLSRFATSLIRVSIGRAAPSIGFFSQVEYDDWCASRRAEGQTCGSATYFKGLGTSSSAMAKDYFRELSRNTIVLRHTGSACGDALDLAFNRKRADDRRSFLSSQCDPRAFVPYAEAETTLSTFVTDELLPQYALSTLRRAIPSLDGFKEATRKVFFGVRVLNLREGISVANVAGKIAARTAYHHRGTSLEDTIIGMAANYAGTSNVNLLVPLGQFGTRHNHTAASAAYPKTLLNDPVQALLYPPCDDPILVPLVDEGQEVEPALFFPIVAMPLVLGCRGIATGWSTDVPPHNPIDVIDATLAYVRDGSFVAMTPWFRGFHGTIVDEGNGSFIVRGLYHWDGNDVHVTEVPPQREVEAYKEDWVRDNIASDVFSGANNVDESVHVVLRNCTLSRDEDLCKRLHLERRVAYTNMHLLDEDGVLRRYSSPIEILRAHARVRMAAYERRILHLIAKAERELVRARNRALFIECVLDGRLVVSTFATDDEVSIACVELGLAALDGGHAYLLDMPMRSLTQGRVHTLMDVAQRAEAELERLGTLTATSEWTRELQLARSFLVEDVRYARTADVSTATKGE